MMVVLHKEDLVNLICGIEPSYDQMSVWTEPKLGTLCGSYDRWTWNKSELKKLSDERLWKIYNDMKAKG